MKTVPPSSLFTSLVCSKCHRSYPVHERNTYAGCCNRPLLAEYGLAPTPYAALINKGDHYMWRYAPLLPVFEQANRISLQEGMTPIHHLDRLSVEYGCEILMKDEGYNPTGSFKARGISMAVSKAKELGIDRLIIATAGNAGGALAAYCAKAGMRCKVVMPENSPAVFREECRWYGADVILVEGLINDCAQKAVEIRRDEDYFDVSTLREPYRLEGKKTMGYEIAEQLDWQLPDCIVYPAGGGTGLIGIWKAFGEMQRLGWISGPLPRMVAVQSANCAPLALAMADPSDWKAHFNPRPSVAYGLTVPYPFGMDLMQEVIRHSNGEVVTVGEAEIRAGIDDVARKEGILLSPEGSAAWMGVMRLVGEKKTGGRKVLFLNTANGYKYRP